MVTDKLRESGRNIKAITSGLTLMQAVVTVVGGLMVVLVSITTSAYYVGAKEMEIDKALQSLGVESISTRADLDEARADVKATSRRIEDLRHELAKLNTNIDWLKKLVDEQERRSRHERRR